MLHVDNDVLVKIRQIQKAEENSRNPTVSGPCMNNVIDLILLFDTYHIDIEDNNHVKTKKFWQLLDTILDYLKNGYWKTLPDLMAGVYVMPRSGTDLSPAQIKSEYAKYLSKRSEVFKSLGLSPMPDFDKKIFYHWLSKPKGFYDMLKVANCICLIYTYYN